MLATATALPSLGVDVRPYRPDVDWTAEADCLHLFGSLPQHLPLVAAARRHDVPVVLSTIAWFDLANCLREPRPMAGRLAAAGRFLARAACPRLPSWRRRLYHAVDRLLPNSNAEARQLIRYFGVLPEKIRAVPNGADPRFADARPEPFIRRVDARGFVLYAGRIEPRKNQLGFLKAMRGTGVPIVVLGDLNMVGDRRSLETLLTGDIADEATYGPDAAPDWDGTALTDAEPPRNGVGPGTWTWRSDGSRYPPGRLDFVLYTDSVAEETRSLVLDTVALPPEVREAAGLEALDVVLERTPDGGYGYDHLPVVVDLRPVGPEGGGG